MRRYVPTLAVAAVIALCLAAAQWQRGRLYDKQDLRARYERARVAAPLVVDDLPREPADWPSLRYRLVMLEGRFDAPRQILLDNKVQDGQPGYEVMTPLLLVDGRAVLVDRGWVPLGRSRAEIPDVPPPLGPLTLAGRVELPPSGYLELGPPPPVGARVWQHLDLARFSANARLPVLPIVIQQTAPAAAGDALRRTWPEPDFGLNTHRMYMLQWYAFALTALVFWAATHWPRRWRRRTADSPSHG
ncbi:MAG: SURF1 family protein [Casimicrobiaceae bacterium]